MKKYIPFIPILGLFLIIYYQGVKHEWMVNDETDKAHFYTSAFVQSISIVGAVLLICLLSTN